MSILVSMSVLHRYICIYILNLFFEIDDDLQRDIIRFNAQSFTLR